MQQKFRSEFVIVPGAVAYPAATASSLTEVAWVVHRLTVVIRRELMLRRWCRHGHGRSVQARLARGAMTTFRSELVTVTLCERKP